jgi:tRNA modification GTPase
MTALAAVMTGKGTGAISTIQLFGDSSRAILERMFRPAGSRTVEFTPGKILLGTITDGSQTIDQVTIGCEGPDTFAINCHGNPLIVEMIMELLKHHGAELVTAEQLLARILLSQKYPSTIHIEAKLALTKVKTLAGAKLLFHQTEHGLVKQAMYWLQHIKEIGLAQLAAEAEQILCRSRAARLIIAGRTAVLAGPPNTGKSTLLNYLAGRQKSIVTDLKGTTRDWVSAQVRIEPLEVTLIDTAGLDKAFAATAGAADRAAQEKARELIQKADLVLLVLDSSQPADQVDESLLTCITDKKVVTVLNKSDLHAKLDLTGLPQNLREMVQISAKLGTGIEQLYEQILQTCGVDSFDPKVPVCFTNRQERLLQELSAAQSLEQAVSVITELLKGPLCV